MGRLRCRGLTKNVKGQRIDEENSETGITGEYYKGQGIKADD